MDISNELNTYIEKLKDKDSQIRNISVNEMAKIKDDQIIRPVVRQLISTFGQVWDSKNYTPQEKKDILGDIVKNR